MDNLKPSEYMRQVLYHAIIDINAKEYEFASNEVTIPLNLSRNELIYLYQCVADSDSRKNQEENE